MNYKEHFNTNQILKLLKKTNTNENSLSFKKKAKFDF